ncbi:GTPase-activating protein [Thecaphora frezii]
MPSHPRQQSSTSARPSSAAGDFEDQAWDIESDDDDFVSRVAPRTNVPRSLKSSSRSSSYSAHTAPPLQPNNSHTGSLRTSVSIAVPVRPTATSASQRHRSSPATATVRLPTGAVSGSDHAHPAAAAEEPSSLNSNASQNRASWTLIDPVARTSPAAAPTEAPIIGSPPTDVAIELKRDTSASGSASGFQLVTSEDAPAASANAPQPQASAVAVRSPHRSRSRSSDGDRRHSAQTDSDQETEEVDLDTGKTVLRKRSGRHKGKPGKREAETLKKAIRPDLDELVKDPVHALSRLSLCWTGPSANTTPVAEAASTSYETNDASLTHPTSTDFAFDPVAAAGDGLIMAGSSFADAETADRGRLTSISGSAVATPPLDGATAAAAVAPERKRSMRSSRRRQQLLACLNKPSIDISALKSLAWAGVPDELRPIVWQLLLGYLPTVASVRAQTLARKRAEYAAGVKLAFAKGSAGLDQAIWHQIHIDVPRTNPGIRLWQREATQQALERILYVWAIRHPASGYVQGINDLATPFFEVFLSAYIDSDPEMYDVSLLPPEALEALEADTFWCLSKLLDGIQDNYIFAQPGIQRQVRRMGELVARIDGKSTPCSGSGLACDVAMAMMTTG